MDSASPIAPPPAPPGPSADDIRKVISDYESRQAKKGDAKGKGKDGDKAEGDNEKEKEKDGKTGAATSSPAGTVSPAAPALPGHRKFALHRQIWEMRKQEMKRKEMSSKAKEVGKGMPQVPRGNF